MMLDKIVILVFLISYVYCLQLDELIEDENQRILSENKGLKTRVYKGRILTIRPKITDAETEEIDNLMAQSFRIGDTLRPLPESDNELQQQLCQGHKERSQKILDFYRKKYANRLNIRLAIRLAVIETNRKNEYYCRDNQTRNYYIRNAKLVNSKINQLKDVREGFVDVLSHFTQGFGKSLSSLLCHYRKYVSQTLSVLPSPQPRNFVEDMIESYYGMSLKYISSFQTEASETCDTMDEFSSDPESNTYAKRSQSVQKSFIEALFLSLNCDNQTMRC